MKRGLHIKLVLIMLLLILSIMTVVCAFLVRGVIHFYQNEFYEQMQQVFSMQEFVAGLRRAAAESDGAARMEEVLHGYSRLLGINSGTRSYYVLSGTDASVLAGEAEWVDITPNILTALTGHEGYRSDSSASYMDVALPIEGGGNRYIVYILDNKRTVSDLNMELFTIIMEALVIGLIISVLLSFLLSKTMVIPIQSLTRAANRVAAGDFSEKIEVHSNDEIGVLTATFNDMATRLRETLSDIENERNKLSTVFLHMTDGVVAFSRDGAMIHFNPAAEQLLDLELEGHSRSFSEIFGDVMTAAMVLELKSPEVLEAERSIADRSLEIFFAPFSGEGAQGGILAVIHDVTQQRRADEQRREFVANVSHELKTPITSIRSYAETLVEIGAEMPEDTRQSFLGVILNESDRMTKIVQDLLALSKFDAGEADMTFEPFALDRSLTHIYDAMILDANKHGLTMTLEMEPALPELVGDRARIEQVVINIISNAVRYTPEGGSIAIRAGREGAGVFVRVTDTGIGIPAEDIPHLFDRFYRVDKARSRAFGGTGLGLSIAKEIVTKHGGEIRVESGLGIGTTVTVTLPLDGRPGDAV